jgi:translocation protein SEC72
MYPGLRLTLRCGARTPDQHFKSNFHRVPFDHFTPESSNTTSLPFEMEDTFLALPLKIDEKTKTVVCAPHSLTTCTQCKLDFTTLNRTHKNFLQLPNDQPIPPPPAKPAPLSRTQQVAKLKDSGNNAYNANKHAEAVKYYSLAIEMSLARPAWDPAAACREEILIILCNRAAARYWEDDYGGTLADAEACIGFRRSWGTAWYWKAKALQEMGLLQEALEAIKNGLLYDADDEDNIALAKYLEETLKEGKTW